MSVSSTVQGPNREIDWHMVDDECTVNADWNTTIVRDVVPKEFFELQAQPGGDQVLSGADIAATFMRYDLIDEYRLYVTRS